MTLRENLNLPMEKIIFIYLAFLNRRKVLSFLADFFANDKRTVGVLLLLLGDGLDYASLRERYCSSDMIRKLYHLGDLGDFAHQICEMMGQDCKEIGERGLTYAKQNLDAKAMSEKYQEVYLDIIEKNRLRVELRSLRLIIGRSWKLAQDEFDNSAAEGLAA